MDKTQKGCFAFLAAGLSPYHAVHAAEKRLVAAGYTPLSETAPWALVPGGKYYTVRGGASLIAFRMPGKGVAGWRGAAAHSDSPTFRFTGTASDARYAKARVEPYGGMRYASWLDRPLTLAGRLLVRTPEGIRPKLIAPDRALLCIPSVCVHFDRAGAKGAALDAKTDLQPIYGAAGAAIEDLLAAECACGGSDILESDLVLAVRDAPCTVGQNEEFYMSSRIDDLAAAYATLEGFLAGKPCEARGDVWCLFDNEEVGSGTRRGALSTFLPDVLARAESALSLSKEQRMIARQNSFFLSADNAHATHPNHPELSDAEHPVSLNGGVVIKYNASQKYTTDGITGAIFSEICRRAGVPVQRFYNRPDLPGGSTLGNLLARSVSVAMVDIGLAQLSMHSAVETAGMADIGYMVRAVKAFYASKLSQNGGGWDIT